MKKTLGGILTILGLVGTIFFGYQAAQDSKSFNLLGLDVAVSKADWTPLIFAGVILLVGVYLLVTRK